MAKHTRKIHCAQAWTLARDYARIVDFLTGVIGAGHQDVAIGRERGPELLEAEDEVDAPINLSPLTLCFGRAYIINVGPVYRRA